MREIEGREKEEGSPEERCVAVRIGNDVRISEEDAVDLCVSKTFMEWIVRKRLRGWKKGE